MGYIVLFFMVILFSPFGLNKGREISVSPSGGGLSSPFYYYNYISQTLH